MSGWTWIPEMYNEDEKMTPEEHNQIVADAYNHIR